jgi:two-component system NarL family response regulator
MTVQQSPAGAERAEDAPGPGIRVLLAGSLPAVVEPLGLRLDAEPGLRVTGTAVEPHEALRALRGRPVDVAVLALAAGAGDFLAVSDAMRTVRPALALIGLPDDDDVRLLERAVRRGFRGWVPMDRSVSALADAVRAVHRGETVIPPELLTGLLRRLLEDRRDPPDAGSPFALLSPRELQVLRELARGGTRFDIAEELGISPNTVRTHTQSILAKLGVHSSVAAVTLALRSGLT